MGALEGKVAVVTGASRGIGEAIAIALADDGADVAVLARTQPDLEKTAAGVRESGRKSQAVICDVTSSASVEAGFEGVWEAFGRVDILVNNAGSRQNFKTVDELPEAEWDAVVDANLKGAFLCSKEAARLMKRNGGGSVVNVASIAGPVAFPRIGAYCAAKAGVIALTRVMAAEWAEHHIRVNAVAPGWIESPMNVELRTEPRNVELYAHLRNQTFLKRFGRPREVADVVTFLASPAASYIDGEVIFIDGGWTAV
ncbi:MAG TPA: SDR family NAD(P)-dependent oxidoreductase [Candidatus Limnocylindrales bacterium]|nr:SDR family NAD(P)-dependent oxidoreductase [Candidatus Limnocylindrales bacterium]